MNYVAKYFGRFFEIILAVLVLLLLVADVTDFYMWASAQYETVSPFILYLEDKGIIIISLVRMLCMIVFIFYLTQSWFIDINKRIKKRYLISAFVIGFLDWFELYYGSTFYYGEVRDKHGWGFPIIASCLFTLIIWKRDYNRHPRYNVLIKLVFSVLLNMGLYLLWLAVQEPWGLKIISFL